MLAVFEQNVLRLLGPESFSFGDSLRVLEPFICSFAQILAFESCGVTKSQLDHLRILKIRVALGLTDALFI